MRPSQRTSTLAVTMLLCAYGPATGNRRAETASETVRSKGEDDEDDDANSAFVTRQENGRVNDKKMDRVQEGILRSLTR